ncbi:ROK family transcriptional regulator [Kineosporia sp. NBRC 101731]|uniref:ROK family transcriptional regulator n=1 Tax=Kineosporia sp. NBRC 101731 TaxID=3032199 RepID=UPI0025521FFD|nr:ROK family transcriptional regulator [Kineosporia sp. NBRC 101731]
MAPAVSSTTDLRGAHLSRALRAVHSSPQALSRADLARVLGCTRATAGALVADLERLGLIEQKDVIVSGGRGRPSTLLGPSANGPVVVAVEIGTDAVRAAHVPVTGGLVDVQTRPLRSHAVPDVLAVVGELLTSRLDALGARVAGVGIAVHGLVDRVSGEVLSAPGLGWFGPAVDVLGCLGFRSEHASSPQERQRMHVGNVATLVAVAETVRGRAVKDAGEPTGPGEADTPGSGADSGAVGTVLVLHADVGLGGALLMDGRAVTGRRGLAGEYGHLPFGTQDRVCRCGARGCWETEVDQMALAREAGLTVAPGAASAAADVVFAAMTSAAGGVSASGRRRGAGGRSADRETAPVPAAGAARATPGTADPANGLVAVDPQRAAEAVHRAAVSLGRGIGALVLVHDPDLVLLSGHAAALLRAAPQVVRAAITADGGGPGGLFGAGYGVLPVEEIALGADAGLVGAAEAVFGALLDDVSLLTAGWVRS